MDPVRFVGRQSDSTRFQETLNQVLAFAALRLGEDGKLRPDMRVRTLPEAEQRAGRLRSELHRQVHEMERRMITESKILGNERFQVHEMDGEVHRRSFAQDVTIGLTAPQKWLPPKYFYDDRGSQLYEQICALPEYYLYRAELGVRPRNFAG
jgi:hypothetical protein